MGKNVELVEVAGCMVVVAGIEIPAVVHEVVPVMAGAGEGAAAGVGDNHG